MWAEAILAKDDLDKVIRDFCPLRIRLGDNGSVLLSEPRDLDLIPALGLRMSVTVEVEWPVLGLQIPVSVRSATLEVRPEILNTAGGNQLTFRLHLAELDISMVPESIDRTIVDRVNKELDAQHLALSWRFTKTLSHLFELPDALASARAIDLCALGGWVKITSDALVLAVSFETRVVQRGARRNHPRAPVSAFENVTIATERSIQSKAIHRRWRPSPASLGLVGAAAFLAIAGVSGLLLVRHRSPGLLYGLLGV
jgi:hypothetical protein